MADSSKVRPVAFVTGSSRGIGRECAIQLAKAGFDLVVHGRFSEKTHSLLFKLSEEIKGLDADCLIVQGAVDDVNFRDTVFDIVLKHYGRLDCMVNNAGTASLVRGDMLEMQEDTYDHCQNINTKGLFFMCQKAANILLQQKEVSDFGLSIVNVTSCSAAILSPSRADYCISKAAASMATQMWALRLADTPVRVFEIRPGIIQTDMTSVVHDKYTNLINNGLVPQRRWGYPQDVARAVVTAACNLLPYTVGQIIDVDGGLHIRNF